MTLTLYQGPISTCSQKVRLALAEKGAAWTSRVMDLPAREHLQPWYLALNTNGVVPTLTDGGTPVVDSSVICEYLEETRQGPAIAPADALGRARMRAWMRYFEETPTVAIRVPSFNMVFTKVLPKVDDAEFQARTDALPLRKHFYRAMGQNGFPQAALEESLDKLRQALLRTERALVGGQDYILGDFSIADIVLIPTVVRMEDLGLTDIWADLPNVAAWYARVQARPSFAAAFGAGTRLTLP